jgi:hypothetical protein
VESSGARSTVHVVKQKLANELDLHLRDLRIIDPSYPTQIQACFAARPGSILFCLENIKIVLRKSDALIFTPSRIEAQEFVSALQHQLTNAHLDTMRFEHVVIETALKTVCQNLFRQVNNIVPAVNSALEGLLSDERGAQHVITARVDELLPLKNKLDALWKRVNTVKKSISDLLDEDEDMAMMFLSSLTPPPSPPPSPLTPTPPPLKRSSSDRSDSSINSDSNDSDSSKYPLVSTARPLSPDEIAVRVLRSAQSWGDSVDENSILSLETLLENYLNEV